MSSLVAAREARPLSRFRERVFPQWDTLPEETALTRAFGATSPASGRG